MSELTSGNNPSKADSCASLVTLTREQIEDVVEDYLGDRLTLSAFHLARLSHFRSSGHGPSADDSDGGGTEMAATQEEELEFLRSNNDFTRLTTEIRLLERKRRSVSIAAVDSVASDGAGGMGPSSMMPSSFSLFDLLPTPPRFEDRVTMHDILHPCVDGATGDGTDVGAPTGGGNCQTTLELCRKVQNVGDLLSDFNNDKNDPEDLAKLLHSILVIELERDYKMMECDTLCDGDGIVREDRTDIIQEWLDLHMNWYEQSVTDYTPFSILLLRNIILHQFHRMDLNRKLYRKIMMRRRTDAVGTHKNNKSTECPSNNSNYKTSHSNDRNHFRKRDIGPIITSLHKMLSILIQSPSRVLSNDIIVLLSLSMFRSDDFPSVFDNDEDDRQFYSASVSSLTNDPHIHWARLDPYGSLFADLLSTLESPLEVDRMVRATGLIEYVTQVFRLGDVNYGSAVVIEECTNQQYAVVVRSLCVLRTLVVQLFSVKTFPYPSSLSSSFRTTASTATTVTAVGIGKGKEEEDGLSGELPTTIEQLDVLMAHIAEEGKGRRQRETTVEDVWRILHPFYSVLYVGISSCSTNNNTPVAHEDSFSTITNQLSSSSSASSSSSSSCAGVGVDSMIMDPNLIQCCEEAIERIVTGCKSEWRLWEGVVSHFVTSLANRIMEASSSLDDNDDGLDCIDQCRRRRTRNTMMIRGVWECSTLSSKSSHSSKKMIAPATVGFYRVCRRILADVQWGKFEQGRSTFSNEGSENIFCGGSINTATTVPQQWMKKLISSLQFLLPTSSSSSRALGHKSRRMEGRRTAKYWSDLNEILSILHPILQSTIATCLFGRKNIDNLLEAYHYHHQRRHRRSTKTQSLEEEGDAVRLYLPLACTVEGLPIINRLQCVTPQLTSYLLKRIWMHGKDEDSGKHEEQFVFGEWTGRPTSSLGILCSTENGCSATLRSEEFLRILLRSTCPNTWNLRKLSGGIHALRRTNNNILTVLSLVSAPWCTSLAIARLPNAEWCKEKETQRLELVECVLRGLESSSSSTPLSCRFQQYLPFLESIAIDADALVFGLILQRERLTSLLEGYLNSDDGAAGPQSICRRLLQQLDGSLGSTGCVRKNTGSTSLTELDNPSSLSSHHSNSTFVVPMNIAKISVERHESLGSSASMTTNTGRTSFTELDDPSSFSPPDSNRLQRLWDVCHELKHDRSPPTSDKGGLPTVLDSDTSYTVRDVVNRLSFLVNDNNSTSTMTPSEANCDCPVQTFVVSVFKFHDLPTITQSKSPTTAVTLSNIVIRWGTDDHVGGIINWLNICILALCRGHINTASALIDSYFTKQHAQYHPSPTSTGKQYTLFVPLLLRQIHRIIEIECPEIQSALDILGNPLTSILTLWLRRSYVGILSFQDAILFNIIVLERPEDAYATYLTVSMIRYLESTIFQLATSAAETPSSSYSSPSYHSSVPVDLTGRLADGFRLVDHLEYADTLRSRHHLMVDDGDDLLKSEGEGRT